MGVLVLEEQDTAAAVAFLTEGRGAPAMLLIVSWDTFEDALAGMEQIAYCGTWDISSQDQKLTIMGYGQIVIIDGDEAQAVWLSNWTMSDEYAVSFFVQHSKLQSFFFLVPAVNKALGVLPPLCCHLVQ